MNPWLTRLLRWSGGLRSGEEPVTMRRLSMAVRTRLSLSGDLRAEFTPGTFARFRGLLLREAADFSSLKARVMQRQA